MPDLKETKKFERQNRQHESSTKQPEKIQKPLQTCQSTYKNHASLWDGKKN